MNKFVNVKMLIEKKRLTNKRMRKDELYEYAALLKIANDANNDIIVMLYDRINILEDTLLKK